MKNRIAKALALLLSFALLSALAACSPPVAVSSAAPSPAQSAPAAPSARPGTVPEDVPTPAAPAFPVTVTDQLGRTVTIREEPETIVSGYYISTSLLIALGLADRLVGVEAKADTRPIYALSAPAVLELPSVGTAKQFDLETCARLEPDLVVLPAKLKDTVPAAEKLGLTVLVVDPEDRALLEEAAVLLGAATGTSGRAEELLQFTRDRLAELEAALADKEASSVYLASNSAFLSCAGPGMYQNDLIVLAGGANAAAELDGGYWSEVSYEQLLVWDPDVIVLAADAGYTAESVLADPALAGLTAIEAGKVYRFPGGIEAWDSPVPGAALGSLWLASVLFPEADIDWQGAAAEFYETFYGFTPDLSALS